MAVETLQSAALVRAEEQARNTGVIIRPWLVTGGLACLSLLLAAVNAIAIFVMNEDHSIIIRQLFELDFEQSIPTWYSVCILCAAGILMACITWFHTVNRLPYARHWFYLTLILFVISADEIAGVHERLSNLRDVFNAGGLTEQAWVIPGIAFVAVVGLLYIRFVLSLPSRIRRLFLIAAAMFVAGAIGLEMLGSLYVVERGIDRTYIVMTIVEELLEMNSIALLIGTLLLYLRDYCGLEIAFNTRKITADA